MTLDALLARNGLDNSAPSMLAYLQRQRWYGSRGRRGASLAVEDAASLQEGDPTVLLVLARVAYEDGGSERYSLPLGLRRCPAAEFFDPEKVIAEVCRQDGSPSAVVNALGDPRSSAVLWELMPGERTVPTAHGKLRCRGAGVEPGVDPASIRPLGREQSNTSLVRGDQELLKWFRQVDETRSPDPLARMISMDRM